MKYVAKRQAELKQLYEMNRAAWKEQEKKEAEAVTARRTNHKCHMCIWSRWETDKKVFCSRFPCIKSN
jgi:hypothetical protein